MNCGYYKICRSKICDKVSSKYRTRGNERVLLLGSSIIHECIIIPNTLLSIKGVYNNL